MSFFYTKQELTVKKHTLNFVLKQVNDVLSSKTPGNKPIGICLNKLQRHQNTLGYLFTTFEASELIEALVFDSFYHY